MLMLIHLLVVLNSNGNMNICVLKSLHHESIVISGNDENMGMVVLNYSEYTMKMMTILGDVENFFIQLGLNVTHDKTKATELKKLLLKL